MDDNGHLIEVTVALPAWAGAVRDVEAWCERAAVAALTGPGGPAAAVEVSVLLTDDEAIRALNRQWRAKDAATNVLSFPTVEPAALLGLAASRDPYPIGDIVVAFETTTREAAAEGKPLRHHLAHLVVHGTLHLLGLDHEDDAAALTMEGLERRHLAGLGVPDPYALERQG